MNEPVEVIPDISPKDGMYQGNISHYYRVGKSAINTILYAMKLANKDISEVKKILDLPSGYGRVLRNLKAVFPNSQITAGDLDKEGVDFCKETFDAIPFYSQKEFEKLSLDDKFDLIWCGSLLTHVDKHKWEPLLNFFSSSLKHNGILVFTVHGRCVVNRMIKKQNNYGLEDSQISQLLKQYEMKGFGYINYLNQENYGISLSTQSFVFSFLEKKLDMRILMYLEKGWDDHHDVIACIK